MCMGGYISQKVGVKRVAMSSLALSCLCCLLFPLLFSVGSVILFIIFLLFWGMVVIADSPLFSTLVAQNAPPNLKGTALTIVNCIGFFITIISIQLLNSLQTWTNTPTILTVLAFGPLIGLMVLLSIR